jgi:hypothetical protein
MRNRNVALLSLVLFVLGAVAQGASGPTPKFQSGLRQFSKRAVSLSGAISDDGQVFVADPDHEVWTAVNPDALKAHAGERAMLQVQESPGTSEIRVLSVKPGEPATRTSARWGDSAFRR